MITTNENDLYTKPKTQLTLLLKPKRAKEAKKAQNRTRSKSQADPSWLYPILLPSIFPTLFCLYKAHHSDEDLQLRIAMSTLQQRTDKGLCEILDIKRYIQYFNFGMHAYDIVVFNFGKLKLIRDIITLECLVNGSKGDPAVMNQMV